MASRSRYLQHRLHRNSQVHPKESHRLLFFLLFVGTILMSLGTLVTASTVAAMKYADSLTSNMAPLSMLMTREISRTAQILDRKGRLLYEVFDPNIGKRTTVPLGEISPYLISATIAAEDGTFYENSGIDLHGIGRAAWSNLTNKGTLQGGSTITQQLVKNVFIPQEERGAATINRKLTEAILAVQITKKYTKDQILEAYLNEIFYGNLSYGIESAAQNYFNKPARDLTLAEASMLAGVPSAPVAYSPIVNVDLAKKRQREVLDLMVLRGYVAPEEAEAAAEVPLEFKTAEVVNIEAPHFVMYVRDLLEQKFGIRGLYYDGLEVTTTLDLDVQHIGEQIIQQQIDRTSQSINGNNAALVSIDPQTGQVLAMVGSADYFNHDIDGQTNVTTSARQPGSSFKPFNYVTAFMKGYNPATVLQDVPVTINDGFNPPYQPLNFDKKFHGAVSIRQALANSMNVPAIRAIQFAGVQSVLDTAHRMGITTLTLEHTYGLSLTLGAGEVTPLDMAFAYSVFANQGTMIGVHTHQPNPPGFRQLDPAVILSVKNYKGKVLEEYEQKRGTQNIIAPEYAYLITDILADNQARVPTFGSALRLPNGRPAAVKTGTTEDLRDFWTIGYTPQLVTAVWMGNSNGMKLSGGTSGSTTGPIWTNFMATVLDGAEIIPFARPENIVTAMVCQPSGAGIEPASPCATKRTEVFVKGQVNITRDNSPALAEAEPKLEAGTALVSLPGNTQTGEQAAVAGRSCCTVPNVVGRSEKEARALLVGARFTVGQYANYQSASELPPHILKTVCVGCVASISIPPGTLADQGTQILIAVRKD